MPWRGEKDPYRVVISEVMLQQTQVSRVIPKYTEFVKTFPNFSALARAPLSKVLTLWNGLGYNRRALFLQKLAKEVVTKHKGVLPQDLVYLELLPGIGKATAGSLSAFAFNRPVPFIETNIRRVFIYSFFSKRKKVRDAEILSLVEKTLDTKNPRLWYYALMDYGAMLKKKIINPNQKSSHYTKQSKFSGSNREVRGAIIDYLTKKKSVSVEKLIKNLSFEKKRTVVSLQSLIKDGMVEKKNKNIQIKNDI